MSTLWDLPDATFADHRLWSGNCYEAAARLVLSERLEGAVLVHGYPVGRGPHNMDRRYGHAWVEAGGQVYDLTIPHGHKGMDAALFYALGHLHPMPHRPEDTGPDIRKYDRVEMVAVLCERKHWGPWHGLDCVEKSQKKRKAAPRKKKAA